MSTKLKDSPTLKKAAVTKSASPLSDKKLQVMEDEINELRKKIIEKDRECEILTKGKSKFGALKSK